MPCMLLGHNLQPLARGSEGLLKMSVPIKLIKTNKERTNKIKLNSLYIRLLIAESLYVPNLILT